MKPSEAAEPSKRTARRGGPLDPGLHVVATPIGNADDITLRALDVLAGADAVLCEDTRRTAKLLALHGLSNRLIAYHDHNAARMRPGLLDRLARGETLALVSDAGTPLVSDPGYKLVRACIEAGIAVRPVPGPSSVLAALVLSGLPSDRFLFAGFLPARPAQRRRELERLAAVPATLVLFETARRLPAALADMAAVLGPRPAAVLREITKLYEEARRGPLDALAARFAETGPPKGEVAVVVGGAEPDARPDAADVDDRLRAALADGGGVRRAASAVAAATGLPRRTLYQRALELARDAPATPGRDAPGDDRA